MYKGFTGISPASFGLTIVSNISSGRIIPKQQQDKAPLNAFDQSIALKTVSLLVTAQMND